MYKNKYLKLLCDHIPSSFEERLADFFMKDGGPCHTAKDVTQWLHDCQVNFFDDWPGNSPDINPIKSLWALIKQEL